MIRHLYVHIPYCVAKCPYCDFNSLAGREEEYSAYVDALLREADHLEGGPYETIFIGGGTPSILPPALLKKLLAGLRERLQLADDYEWTMEANPGSVDAERFALAAAYGINRLSLGIQSVHEHHLRFLGRVHSVDEAERALALATTTFPRVSADMIVGLPEQSVAEIVEEIAWYQRHGLRHASIYHLAYEPGTEFYARHRRGELKDIDAETSLAILDAVEQGMKSLGMQAYETSNYAVPGEESRHNLGYWRQHDYEALGAGAVSTVKGERLTRQEHPARYIEALDGREDLYRKREHLSAAEVLRECWMLGLRLAEGVSLRRLEDLGDAKERWQPLVDELSDWGLLELSDGHIRLSAAGRRLQDAVTVKLLPD